MYFHTMELWNIQIDLGPLDPASRQGTAHVFQALTKHQKKTCDCGRICSDKNMHWTISRCAYNINGPGIEEEHPNTCNACHCHCWATRRARLQFGLHLQPSMQFPTKNLPLLEVHGTLFLPHFLQVFISSFLSRDTWHPLLLSLGTGIIKSKSGHADWVQISEFLCCHSGLINKLHFNWRPLLVSVHIWSRKAAQENCNFWLSIWAADSSFNAV